MAASVKRSLLKQAISRTFAQRKTPISDRVPIGLTHQYLTTNPSRKNQWQKIYQQSKVNDFTSFEDAIDQINNFLMPVKKTNSSLGKL